MGALQEDGIGQSGLAAGEAASDCKSREGERIESMAAVGAGFLLIFLIVWWVLRDRAERNVTVPYDPGMLVALIAVIGLPFYLFRSRRFAAGHLAMTSALCIGLLGTVSATMRCVGGRATTREIEQAARALFSRAPHGQMAECYPRTSSERVG